MAGGSGRARWTAEAAAAWRDRIGWLIGCNYVPAYASNQIEMWAADTFDVGAIDRELHDAAGLGFNVLRVYLHDLLFAEDPSGFIDRLDRFLTLAAGHGLRVVPVIFDSVWNPEPQAGPQPEPTWGVHNAGWVQSPGVAIVAQSRRGLPPSRDTCEVSSAASATIRASCCGTCGTSRTIPTPIPTVRRTWGRARPRWWRRCSISRSNGRGQRHRRSR